MKKKMAIVMFELVDESMEERNEKIMQELRNWFSEDAVSIPWTKEILGITAKRRIARLKSHKKPFRVLDFCFPFQRFLSAKISYLLSLF
jgi:hypothetical protein